MKKFYSNNIILQIITSLLFIILSNVTFAQNFINGDFELNSAFEDQINLSNADFNDFMADCNAFGTFGNLDIITSPTYSGAAQNGNWFVALTGGGTDMIALTLTAALINGNSYTISYYDKKDVSFTSLPIEIGLSNVNNSFGTLIHTASGSATNSTWTQRTFTFVAPNNGQYITVRQSGQENTSSNWVQIDNLSFDCSIYLNLGNDTTICQDQTVTLNGGTAISYLWSNSSTDSTINISTPGTYWLQASNGLCSSTDSIEIFVNQFPFSEIGNDTSICEGENILLNGGLATSYLWSNFSTDSIISVSNTGIYWVQLSNGTCSSYDTIKISVNQYPLIDIGRDTTICQGEVVELKGGIADFYLWSNFSTASSIYVVSPDTYWLQASNGQCSVVDSVKVSLANCEIAIELPNFFTPNSDGFNDQFIFIKHDGITKVNLQVFNRWGETMFNTEDFLQGWDGYNKGKICSEGTYFWILEYSTIKNESKKINGFLTLIR